MTHSFDSGRDVRGLPPGPLRQNDASDQFQAQAAGLLRDQNIGLTRSTEVNSQHLIRNGLLPNLSIDGQTPNPQTSTPREALHLKLENVLTAREGNQQERFAALERLHRMGVRNLTLRDANGREVNTRIDVQQGADGRMVVRLNAQDGNRERTVLRAVNNNGQYEQMRDSQGRPLSFSGDYFANGRQNARAEHRRRAERSAGGEVEGGRPRRRTARRSSGRSRRRSGGGRRSSGRAGAGGGSPQRSSAAARAGTSQPARTGHGNVDNSVHSPDNDQIEEENNDEMLEA